MGGDPAIASLDTRWDPFAGHPLGPCCTGAHRPFRHDCRVSDEAQPVIHELFGEMSFLENAAASTNVIADVPCRIDIVEREAIYELLAGRPGFAGRFFQSLATLLSDRLRQRSALLEAALSMPSGSEPAS